MAAPLLSAMITRIYGSVFCSPLGLLRSYCPRLCRYCASILRPRYEVIEFSNGETALQYVIKHSVDLVVSGTFSSCINTQNLRLVDRRTYASYGRVSAASTHPHPPSNDAHPTHSFFGG